MKVVSFTPPTRGFEGEVQEDIVQMLEDWLADAKAGRFSGVAICGVLHSGEVQTNVAKHSHHPALVGAVTILQARLLRLVEPIVVED